VSLNLGGKEVLLSKTLNEKEHNKKRDRPKNKSSRQKTCT
jgi:hypothetical protein